MSSLLVNQPMEFTTTFDKKVKETYSTFSLGDNPKSSLTKKGSLMTAKTADTYQMSMIENMGESLSKKSANHGMPLEFGLFPYTSQNKPINVKDSIAKLSMRPTDYYCVQDSGQHLHEINSMMNLAFKHQLELFEDSFQRLTDAANDYLAENEIVSSSGKKSCIPNQKEYRMMDMASRKSYNPNISFDCKSKLSTKKKISKVSSKKSQKKGSKMKNFKIQDVKAACREMDQIILPYESKNIEGRLNQRDTDEFFKKPSNSTFGDRSVFGQRSFMNSPSIGFEKQYDNDDSDDGSKSPNWYFKSPSNLHNENLSDNEPIHSSNFWNEGAWLSKVGSYGIQH